MNDILFTSPELRGYRLDVGRPTGLGSVWETLMYSPQPDEPLKEGFVWSVTRLQLIKLLMSLAHGLGGVCQVTDKQTPFQLSSFVGTAERGYDTESNPECSYTEQRAAFVTSPPPDAHQQLCQ